MVYALPWGNHALQQLRLEIITQSISQQVQPRVFYEEWEGKVVYVFEMPPGEERWKGVFLAESIPSARTTRSPSPTGARSGSTRTASGSSSGSTTRSATRWI